MLLENVSWDYYERTLREFGEQHIHARVTYDRGRMEIMSPSSRHEWVKGFIRQLIESYAFERQIEFLGLGSVTCRREDLVRGVEPDECYYVQHQPRDRDDLDLTVDPPPDLAIEVDITSSSVPRQPIYGALGVPEIWRFDGQRLIVLRRQGDGSYEPSAQSLVFPDLRMDDFNRFVRMGLAGVPSKAVLAFRDWLRSGGTW